MTVEDTKPDDSGNESSAPNRFRDSLNGECRACGKSKEEADEILPVCYGHWSLGPEWSCGGCAGRVGAA